MRLMRRLIVTIAAIVALFIVSVSSSALGRKDITASLGGQTVTTGVTISTTKVMKSYPGATITVCTRGTDTLASIYTTNSGATPKSNPFTADNYGNGYFYAADGYYRVKLSGGGLPYTVVLEDQQIVGASTVTVNIKDFGAKCDGTTDDRAAIQAAFDSGAYTVEAPPGVTCVVKSVVNLPSNATFRGYDTKFIDPTYRTGTHHRFFSAVSVSDIAIIGIKIFGDNSVYPTGNGSYVATDGFTTQGDNFSNGVGIFFNAVTNGRIEDVETRYMWESAVIYLSTDVVVDHYKSQQSTTTPTEHPLGLVGNTRVHVKHAYVSGGGDGALYIYNSSYSSIEDSSIINNNPTNYLAASGIESSDHCYIRNVYVKGAFQGFTLGEGLRGATISDSVCDQCHVGFFIGRIGSGSAIGYDASIINNRVVNMIPNANISIQPAAFYINFPGTNYISTPSIRIQGNYVGYPSAGSVNVVGSPGNPVMIYASNIGTLGSGIPLNRLVITGNTFDGTTYNQPAGLTLSYQNYLASLTNVTGAVINNNTWTARSDAQDTTGAIRLFGCQKIGIVGNTFTQGSVSAATQSAWINADSSTFWLNISGNEISDAGIAGANPYAITLAGAGHLVSGNQFNGDGNTIKLSSVSQTIVSNNNTYNLSSGFFVNWAVSTATTTQWWNNRGYDEIISKAADYSVTTGQQRLKFVTTAAAIGSLPAASPGQEYTFISTSGNHDVLPNGTDTVGVCTAGQKLRLPTGSTATIRAIGTGAGAWAIISASGTNSCV